MSDFPVLFPDSALNKANGSEITIENGNTTINAVDYPLVALNLYGKSVQNGTPTPDAPVDIVSVGDDGALEVTVCGKNLLSFSDIGVNTNVKVVNGVVTQVKSDTAVTPTVILQGIKKDNTIKYYSYRNDLSLGVYYVTFSYAEEMQHLNFGINGSTIDTKCRLETNTLEIGKTYTLQVKFTNITQGSISWENIQIELGTTATAYEPYKGNTATITSGLPLCSVGEYRDELIYNADGTGKIIKKTNIVYLDGSSDEYYTSGTATDVRTVFGIGNIPSTVPQSQTLCNITSDISITPDNITITTGNAVNIAFGVNLHIETIADLRTWLAKNPMTIIYILKTPQEITLSAAEMAELQKLQTFDGMTNIHNDEGAEMTVKVATNPILSEYVKPVIDGITTRFEARIAALESAIANN